MIWYTSRMYRYSPENARLYQELGLVGTTYEISFNQARKMLGNLQGKTILDFGTGTGRSALLLKSLGASRVLAIDHDPNMIKQANSLQAEGVSFCLMQDQIPFASESVDAALSAHVFVETPSLAEMTKTAKEIARVLKPSGSLVVITTNPGSIGHDFISYRYLPKSNLKSGDRITCLVKGSKSFEIEDYYWTEDDYRQVFRDSGFMVEEISYPLAQANNGWLEETKVAPDVVFKCRRHI